VDFDQLQTFLEVARHASFSRALSLLAFLGLLCLSAATQTPPAGAVRSIPPSDSKLIDIKISGSKRFTQDEVAAASGLLLGAAADDEQFRKSARQLGETGAFSAISYTFTYSAAGTRLAFQVADADKFVPAHFFDFVWFPDDQELLRKVHERAPLFDGELPSTGRLPDQVSDILQALLVENGIPGQVEFVKSTGAKGQLQSFDYGVANVTIRIRRVEFTGAGAEELPLLNGAAERFSGRDYSRALLNSLVDHALLPIYRERGYLKATCAPAQPRVVKPAAAEAGDDKGEVTLVDVTVPVTPGLRYKLAGWNWSGNKEIPSNELQPFVHAKVGQPANTVQLEDDLLAVQQLYGSRGLVTATIKVNASFDEAAAMATYQLEVTEGDIYRMGELEFRGIDNALTAKLRAAWRIRTGDVYDSTYLKQYLPQARRLLPPTIDWEVAPHVTAIARDKTVDVDLQYTAKAPQ
jgi:outer membrane protein assembly factor BamA